MWEGLVRAPQGRISLRKFITLFATLLVACFAYTLAITTPASALDATWTDDNQLVYDNQTYKGPYQTRQNDGLNLANNVRYYTYTPDSSRTPYDVWVIYFAPGTDPPTATTATYAKYSYNGTKYSSKSDVEPVTVTQSAAGNNNPSPTTGDSSCVVEGIGWIICPATTFLAKGMDTIYSLVDGFLEVRPLSTSTDQPMYRVWSYFLNIANILFIIGILIMIYAQITGAVLSNYTIKKILPRVIISAVFVNLSYWICAIAIDLTNILGYSIQDMFIAMRNTVVGSEGNSWDVISWESFASLVLSGGSIVAGGGIAAYLGISAAGVAVAGAGVAGLIFLVLPLLISVLFVVLMTFLILAARQAILTILVILAPLAVVAYLLPNTEEWFTKWRKTFITLLLVFPGFSVIFGGSQLAAAIIIQNATSLNIILLGMAVQVVPLAITPLLLKLGGGVLNRFAGVVNNPTKGIFDRGKNWAKDRSGQHRAAGIAALDTRAKTRGFNDGKPIRSTRTTRRGRFIENTGNKLNPYNVAYKREYDRREREGMKSANESMSEGLFVQTAAGRRIYSRTQDAGLEKHAGEESNYKAYKSAMATGTDTQNAYRRHLHHQAHIDKGFGDIYEEQMKNHAERDLQDQIVNNVGSIKDVKIRATVDAGIASSSKKLVDAQGSLQLEETILASTALRNQSKMIHEYEGRAAQAKALIEDEGKAHWEKLSLDDQVIYSRQLERQANAKKLKALQDTWESILTEASAGHTEDYQRRHGQLTQHVTDQIDVIREANETIAVEEKRKANAEYVFKSTLNKRLKTDDALLERAAGIDEYGRTKVVAQLYKEGSALHMQNVEAVESTFSNEGYDAMELIKVYQEGTLRGGEPATEMHVHAAIRQLATEKANNTAMQKMSDYMATQGMVSDSGQYYDVSDAAHTNPLDEDEVERRRNLQQIYADAMAKTGHQVTHLSGTDKSALQTGTYTAGTTTAILRDIATGKIKAERVGKMDIDEMVRSLQIFRDNPAGLDSIDTSNRQAYVDVINEAMNDPIIGAKLELRHRRALEAMKLYLDPSTPTPDTTQINTVAGRVIPTTYDPLTLVD